MVESPTFGAELGIRIKEARVRLQLSQGELARLVKLSRVQIARYEAGQQQPNAETMWRLADALGVKLEDLIPPVAS